MKKLLTILGVAFGLSAAIYFTTHFDKIAASSGIGFTLLMITFGIGIALVFYLQFLKDGKSTNRK